MYVLCYFLALYVSATSS